MRRASGFTLIELLLVLAIMGILATIAVASLVDQREKSRAQAVKDQTIVILGDLTAVLGELSDPPSERRAEFPTTIYSGAAADNQTKARDAIGIVMGRTNFATARNPYTSAGRAYEPAATPAAGGGTLGLVYLDALTANNTADPVITVTGVFRNPKGDIQHLNRSVAVN